MSIVGVFVQTQPSINGLVFDASLRESTELSTQVTEYTVETGVRGQDHAVQSPLRLTMTLGVSDNPFRALASQAGDLSTLAGSAGSTLAGAGFGTLDPKTAAAAGLAGSIANAAYAAGQARTRSQTVLEKLREMQRRNLFVEVVTLKRTYENCLITNTAQETNRENENGLEVEVELTQLLVTRTTVPLPEVPAPNDSVTTQAQEPVDLGLVGGG